MYDFERPTKLELIGFVHPNYRKQRIGTTLLQTAMKEIRLRGADEALLIMNGSLLLGKNLQYIWSCLIYIVNIVWSSKEKKFKNDEECYTAYSCIFKITS